MKILISGGTGFLGVRLAEELLRMGNSVRILARKKRAHPYLDNLPVEWAMGDVAEAASLEQAMQGCAIVFHCAGLISYDPRKADQLHAVNVIGTRNVAEAALKLKVQRLIHTSSTAAIGVNYDPKNLMNEQMPFNARPLHMAYFDTKWDAEAELHKLAERGLNYVIVNPGSIIGPRDTRRYEQVYAGLIYRLKPPIAPPGGNNFVDIEDVVAGHILAWQKGRRGERYILGGENLSFGGLIARTNAVIGRKPPLLCLPVWTMAIVAFLLKLLRWCGYKFHMTPELVRQMGSWYLYVDSSKAKRELGYNPKPIDAALRRTIDWLKAERRI